MMRLQLTPQIEIAIGAFFLGVGLAGPPLEPLRILIAVLLALAASQSGKFIGAVAMLATIVGGYVQHQQLRLSVLIGGAAIGAAAHFLYRRPRAATAIGALAAVAGIVYLFLG